MDLSGILINYFFTETGVTYYGILSLAKIFEHRS